MSLLSRLGPVAEERLDELHLDLLDPPRHPDRPHVALNFVLTADGRASFQGRAEIGTRADRALLHHLRALADAVLIGAGTLRVDPFAPRVRGEAALARRAAAGKAAEPIAAVVSASCVLPLDNRFFALAQPRLVLTTERAGAEAVAAVARTGAEVVRLGADEVEVAPLLALFHERGVRLLLCEGGPRLAAALLDAGAADELFLTHATLVTAEPDARRLFDAPRALRRETRLESVSLHVSRDGERYERARLRYL
ncbi:MAG: dihydrofolate reductase family protein [Candidatus Limnocylindria bacterium]